MGLLISLGIIYIKVHIFWEGHKILQNLHLTFVLCSVVKSKVKISQNFVAFSEYMNFTIHYKSKFPKKFLAELVFLYIDSILLWNQDWLIDWVEFNQHCRSWRLRLRATPIWKMLQCTMGPKHFFKSFLKSYSSLQVVKF